VSGLQWSELGTIVTNAFGAADFPTAIAQSMSYYASFAGNATYGAATSTNISVTAVPPLTTTIAVGTRPTTSTAYVAAVKVANGSKITVRAQLGSMFPSTSVQLWMRLGKFGAWTRVSTGVTNAAGTATFVRTVSVASTAIGYGRYVYFRAVVPASVLYGGRTGSAVRAVVTR
jgi:hypothetical protein